MQRITYMLVIFSELISHYITYCQAGNNYFILCSITLHAPLLKAGGVFGTFPQGLFFRWKKQPFKSRGRLCHIPGRGLFFSLKKHLTQLLLKTHYIT